MTKTKKIAQFTILLLYLSTIFFSVEVIGSLEFIRLNEPIEAIQMALRSHGDLSHKKPIPHGLQNLSYTIYPNSPGYDVARHNYNKRYNVFPQAIIAPETFEQAQYVLKILIKHRLKFSVRSGKHCFEPGSLSPNYIFDLKNFNAIIPNLKDETVFIGAGALLTNVISTLGNLNYTIPTGTCPTVGVGGLALGGGLGLLSPSFGLTCNSILSIILLTADAEIIEVNANHHPDLFWALRGAGNGSYGIVLGYTFQMHYVPVVTFYELLWEYDSALIPTIMSLWQEWVKTLPSSASSVLGIRHPGTITAEPHLSPSLVIRIYGINVGSEPFTAWEALFQQLNPKVKIHQGRYIDTVKYWSSEPKQPFNKAKSRILMKPINKKTIHKVEKFFEELELENPTYLVYFNFEVFGGNIKKGSNAFFPKNAFGWWFQAYYWDQQDQTNEVLTLSRKFYSQIPKEVSKYCYANVVDYDLGKSYLRKYYGNHVNRLIHIKNIYDPMNVFHWKQSIPLRDP